MGDKGANGCRAWAGCHLGLVEHELASSSAEINRFVGLLSPGGGGAILGTLQRLTTLEER